MLYLQFISVIISSIFSYISVILIPISYFGYSIRFVKTDIKDAIISKKIKWSSMRNEENEPYGFFVGWVFFGYRFETSSNPYLYCFCTKKTFEELNVIENIEIINTDSEINIYTASSHRYNHKFVNTQIYISHLIVPRHQQKICMNKIIDKFNENNYVTVFINGSYGSGKSSIGLLLAKELNASFCKEIHFIEPNQMMSNLYNQVSPTKEKPLIIMLDEFDIIIEKIHDNNNIIPHKYLRTQVTNKIQWNTLLDDIKFYYLNIIIILTTNLTREEFISKYDESYIRKGRVNLFETL